jgi:hypothetical protein
MRCGGRVAFLFESGHVVDLVLILMALEGAVLLAWRWRTGRGVPPGDLVGYLASGACLLMALRAALTGAWWGWIGLWLALGGIAHVVDLARRWRA